MSPVKNIRYIEISEMAYDWWKQYIQSPSTMSKFQEISPLSRNIVEKRDYSLHPLAEYSSGPSSESSSPES